MKHAISMTTKRRMMLTFFNVVAMELLVSGPIWGVQEGTEFSRVVKNEKPPIESEKKAYYSPEAMEEHGYVRISEATILFTESARAILHFRASAMTNARFPSRETAPSVSIRFLTKDGRYWGNWLPQVAIATVGKCNGHEEHEVDITGFIADDLFRSAYTMVTAFDIKMSEAKKVHVC